MHVALIANTAWLDEELSTFRHLVVGLLAEQVRVVQVVPEGVPAEETSGFGDRLTWQDSGWQSARRRSLLRLGEALEKLEVDVIHALDGRVWEPALRLADRLGAAAVMSSASAMDLALVEPMRDAGQQMRIGFAPATTPLAQAMAEKLGPDMPVQVIPPGVHVPEASQDSQTTPLEIPAEASPLCAVISGNGLLDENYLALFEALQATVHEHPQSQFFFDSQGVDQRRLWQQAERVHLLGNASFVPRRLGHREVLLNADVLIHPQALGRCRSLVLRAMAHGVPVLARPDPWLDYLIDDTTAWLTPDADAEHWSQLVQRVLDHPERARALGRSARQYVRDHHSASAMVQRTIAMYCRVSAEAIKFPGRG